MALLSVAGFECRASMSAGVKPINVGVVSLFVV